MVFGLQEEASSSGYTDAALVCVYFGLLLKQIHLNLRFNNTRYGHYPLLIILDMVLLSVGT